MLYNIEKILLLKYIHIQGHNNDLAWFFLFYLLLVQPLRLRFIKLQSDQNLEGQSIYEKVSTSQKYAKTSLPLLLWKLEPTPKPFQGNGVQIWNQPTPLHVCESRTVFLSTGGQLSPTIRVAVPRGEKDGLRTWHHVAVTCCCRHLVLSVAWIKTLTVIGKE